jgi:RimJ/RimL family protein N-acetyltransferase
MASEEVRTARLVLRPISPDDAEGLAALYADPEVTRWVRALDLPATRAQIDRFVEQWAARGIGPFAVLDADTGDFFGRSGVKYWPEFDFTEVGWVLRRDVWGRGFATEAGRASLDYAFAHSDLEYVTAIIAKPNLASIAVAERLGMAQLRDEVVFETDCTIYAVAR